MMLSCLRFLAITAAYLADSTTVYQRVMGFVEMFSWEPVLDRLENTEFHSLVSIIWSPFESMISNRSLTIE